MEFDPVLLARIQFGFTIAFHIIFPSFTIGLASWLVVLELFWLATAREVYWQLSRFWTKVFAVSFGMGVVSGVVLSYQFGTNWSGLSDQAGNILGPLLSYEVLTAFFLEASFLGIMLFGWQRVPPGLHLFATCMVAVGTLISAFWIIAANSWMQTPAGHELRDGIFYPVDWFDIVFNPSFPYRLTHMVTAAYLTTAFAVGGTGAWYVLKGRSVRHGRIMLLMALGLTMLLAPAQIVIGDMSGLNAVEYQPAKIAAIEAHWETQRGAPLILFALPDQEAATNHYEIALPKLGSLILTHSLDGKVTGLHAFPADQWPYVPIVFWSFRIMAGIGFAMVFLAAVGLYLCWRQRLFATRWFLRLMTFSIPLGFIAVIAGWITAEVGRQPWVVYEQLRTADAVSPVPGGNIAVSLALFVLVYGIIFGAGTFYIIKLIRKGPAEEESRGAEAPPRVKGTPARPLSAVDDTLQALE
jgi:cytochrome d ubiquinol oxidase subunit I